MHRIAAAALALLLPALATAQETDEHPPRDADHGMQHGHPAGAMMHGPGMPMMLERPGPGMLLRVQAALDLTEKQVARLTELHEQARASMREHAEAAREARMRAHEALMAESPDLDAAESALTEAAGHDVQGRMAMARTHLEAGSVLTDAQRATLTTITDAMRELRGARQHGEPGSPIPHRNRMHRQPAGSSG